MSDGGYLLESLSCELRQAHRELNHYRRALEEIANMDYRGNRSHEQGIAWRALQAVRKDVEDRA